MRGKRIGYDIGIEGRWIVEKRAGGKNVGEQTIRQIKDGNDRQTKGNSNEDS